MLRSKLDNLTLLGDRIAVRPVEEEKKTSSGIIIAPTTENAKKFFTGIVIKAGKGKMGAEGKREEMIVKEGDTVLFHRYTGLKVKAVDNTVILLTQGDVELVIKEETK